MFNTFIKEKGFENTEINVTIGIEKGQPSSREQIITYMNDKLK